MHPLQLEGNQLLSHRLGQGGGRNGPGPSHSSWLVLRLLQAVSPALGLRAILYFERSAVGKLGSDLEWSVRSSNPKYDSLASCGD